MHRYHCCARRSPGTADSGSAWSRQPQVVFFELALFPAWLPNLGTKLRDLMQYSLCTVHAAGIIRTEVLNNEDVPSCASARVETLNFLSVEPCLPRARVRVDNSGLIYRAQNTAKLQPS